VVSVPEEETLVTVVSVVVFGSSALLPLSTVAVEVSVTVLLIKPWFTGSDDVVDSTLVSVIVVRVVVEVPVVVVTLVVDPVMDVSVVSMGVVVVSVALLASAFFLGSKCL
jgi:hypothetical protein